MIIEHYHGFVNIEKLRTMTNTTKNGTTAYDIKMASLKLGFECFGIRLKIDEFSDKTILPAIAHVTLDKKYNHFVVIYEINFLKNYLIIADPASNLKKMRFKEFEKIYNGILLILYPKRKIIKENKISLKKDIKNLFFKNNPLYLFVIMSFSISLSFSFLILIRNMLTNNPNNLNILITLLIIFLKFILNYFKDYVFLNKKIMTSQNLMNTSFLDIISLPYSYYRNRTTGEIISRINDIDTIKDIMPIFITVITDIILTLTIGVLLYLTNHTLSIIVFIITLFYLFNFKYFHQKLISAIEELKNKKSLINSFMTEAVIGFESIKGQNLEKNFYYSFKIKNKDCLDSLKHYHSLENKMNNLNDLISDLLLFIILFLGMLFIQNKLLTLVDLIVFYTLMNYFLEPIKNISTISIIIKDLKVSLKRLIELKYNINKKSEKTIFSKIKIKNLFFKQNDKLILSNLNLTIEKSEKVMLFGSSGCGKSTLLKLLKQYYTTNSIYIDNTNILKLNLKDNITYISQNEYLFTDTLYNNIVMNNKIEEEKLKLVIKICELDEILKKDSMGLNMLIEENGFNLSGGEKQRIVLARALINIKNYLFIDEGLSEVDINLERKIIKNLFKYYKNKTIILVSHRKDNVDLFDKMICLDKLEVLTKNKGGSLCLK